MRSGYRRHGSQRTTRRNRLTHRSWALQPHFRSGSPVCAGGWRVDLQGVSGGICVVSALKRRTHGGEMQGAHAWHDGRSLGALGHRSEAARLRFRCLRRASSLCTAAMSERRVRQHQSPRRSSRKRCPTHQTRDTVDTHPENISRLYFEDGSGRRATRSPFDSWGGRCQQTAALTFQYSPLSQGDVRGTARTSPGIGFQHPSCRAVQMNRPS